MSFVNDFTLARSNLRVVGKDLRRPENLIAGKDSTILIADGRGRVTRLNPDGSVSQRYRVGR